MYKEKYGINLLAKLKSFIFHMLGLNLTHHKYPKTPYTPATTPLTVNVSAKNGLQESLHHCHSPATGA